MLRFICDIILTIYATLTEAMIIDIHTHIFPDELATRALATLSNNSGVQPFTDGTLSGLCDSMRLTGIDQSAIMPIATKPSQARSINQWAVTISQQHENIISFGTIHPMQDAWQLEIDFLVENGIRGIKLHPDYQDFFVDDLMFAPMYHALADAGLIVMFHAGVDIGLPPPVHCTPERLARMLDMSPTLQVIAAHMGGYDCWDDVEQYLVGRELYFDTSFSLSDLGYERMTALIKAHGSQRILFGTDSPWTDQSVEVKAIQALPLTDDEITAILGETALNLLHDRTR